MHIRVWRMVWGGLLLSGLALVGAAVWFYATVTAAGPLAAPADILIPGGVGPRAIAVRLQESGVISNAHVFGLYVRLRGWSSHLQAGEYIFPTAVPMATVARTLAEGETQNRTVTIPEGFTVKQVLSRLEAIPALQGTAPRPEEGYVFPDTYVFRLGTSRADMLAQMQKRMTTELAKAWESRTTNIPLATPADLLTLASIVQKEAASEAEMPKIAGVFINRLNRGMKLQSDPTVIYGAELDGRLRKKDLTEPHPFNTYVYAGLPPTPIANPGRAALRATAQPDTAGNYLYFVATPSLTMHVFSATYKEHQKNVAAYWKGMATRNISATFSKPSPKPSKESR